MYNDYRKSQRPRNETIDQKRRRWAREKAEAARREREYQKERDAQEARFEESVRIYWESLTPEQRAVAEENGRLAREAAAARYAAETKAVEDR